MGWLEEEVSKYHAADSYAFQQQAKYLELLLSPSPDAARIRKWFKKNARQNTGKIPKRSSGRSCEDWEFEIWFLSHRFSDFQLMDAWEIAPTEKRRSHADHVSRLCRELADTLEEEIRPYYPPVLQFFDTERAVDIIRSLPERNAKFLLDGTGFSLDWRDCYKRNGHPSHLFADGKPAYLDPSSQLKRRFSFKPQQFPSMLRQLADYAVACTKQPKRDQRPNFPNRDARVFAREIAEHFRIFFKSRPIEVIVSCVALMFPDLDPPPHKDLIRGWLGDK